MTRHRSLRGVLAVVALLAIAVPTEGASVTVHIRDDAVMRTGWFDPVVRTIDAGTQVVWTNDGGLVHTVTAQPGAPEAFDSQVILSGGRYSRTFSKPGTYNYYCTIHGRGDVAPDPGAGPRNQPCGMCGIIKVRGAQPSPTAKSTPSASPTPKQTRRPTGTPTTSASPSTSPDLSPEATGTEAAAGGGAGGPAGRIALGLVIISVLAGAGYAVWRYLIAA